MKNALSMLFSALSAVLLGAGCIAIPMGQETFTTEYPTDIRATWASPTKTYEPELSVEAGDTDNRTVVIGLFAEVTESQPREQHHERVSLVKKKYISFGFFPSMGDNWTSDTNALCRETLPYQGDDIYSTMGLKNPPKDKPNGSMFAWNMGADPQMKVLCGLFYTPFSLLFGAFLPYESGQHVTGRFLGAERKLTANGVPYTSLSYSVRDVELLLKFPPPERDRIGAWTYHEDVAHPQNTFRNSYGNFSWFGFHKWVQYTMGEPTELSPTPVDDPKISKSRHVASGPYALTLSLPSLGYCGTADVKQGQTAATFNLLDAANGETFANGTVSFLPPEGGLAAIRNENDRALLELAMEHEWPVTVALPAPRLGATSAGNAIWQIASIEHPEPDVLVVRVRVADSSRIFEIDRAVQPEVKRMFHEQFANGENVQRTERVRMELDDDGKTIVYTAGFE